MATFSEYSVATLFAFKSAVLDPLNTTGLVTLNFADSADAQRYLRALVPEFEGHYWRIVSEETLNDELIGYTLTPTGDGWIQFQDLSEE